MFFGTSSVFFLRQVSTAENNKCICSLILSKLLKVTFLKEFKWICGSLCMPNQVKGDQADIFTCFRETQCETGALKTGHQRKSTDLIGIPLQTTEWRCSSSVLLRNTTRFLSLLWFFLCRSSGTLASRGSCVIASELYAYYITNVL